MTENHSGPGTGAVKPPSPPPQNGQAPLFADSSGYAALRGLTVAPGGAQAQPGRSSGSPRLFLRAHLVEIVVITLVVTAAAAFFSGKQTKMYSSQAEVAVYPSSSASSTQQALDMGTEKLVASSGVVLALASDSLHVPQSQLRSGLSVGVPVDANLLTISFSDKNPQVARRLAQGLAEAYVNYRSVTVVGDGLQAVIITDAPLPTSPAGPKRAIDVGVAVILGLALGFGTALLRDWMDDRVRGRQDLENESGAEVLAVIPAFGHTRYRTRPLAVLSSPHSPVADAYRNLRTRVVQAAARRGVTTLLVVSPDGDEKGTTAANLAVALAQSGKRVVLVCADLRTANAQGHFGVENEPGLTSVVSVNASLASVLRPTAVSGLQIVPAGPLSYDPGAVLQSPALPELITALSRSVDFVVLASSPMLDSSDVSVLAELADMVLFVADARRSTRAQVRAALQELDPVRNKVIGCVLDNVGKRVPFKPAPTTPPRPDTNVEPMVQGPPAGATASTTSTRR